MDSNVWPVRFYALDASRGIAALSVVLWHWQHFAYDGATLGAEFTAHDQPYYPLLKIFYEKGSLGVEYFFILSGFIFFWLYLDDLKNRRITGSAFFLQRFSRLYPLHFITLLSVVFLQSRFHSITGQPFVYGNNDIYHFILNLGLASHWGLERGWSFNAPIWSVSVELLAYAVFFFVAISRRGGLLFCGAAAAGAMGLFVILQHSAWRGLGLFFLGGGIFHLATWLSISRSSLNRSRIVRQIYLMTVLVWLCVLSNYYLIDLANPVKELGPIGSLIIMAFPVLVVFPLTILSLILLESNKRISVKPVAWVGDITYSSYLLHFPLQLIFSIAVAYKLLPNDFFLKPYFLIVFFTILIMSSILTFKFFEMPVQKIIRQRYSITKK